MSQAGVAKSEKAVQLTSTNASTSTRVPASAIATHPLSITKQVSATDDDDDDDEDGDEDCLVFVGDSDEVEEEEIKSKASLFVIANLTLPGSALHKANVVILVDEDEDVVLECDNDKNILVDNLKHGEFSVKRRFVCLLFSSSTSLFLMLCCLLFSCDCKDIKPLNP